MRKPKESTPKIVKRSKKRVMAVFIDGVGLDRATRRMNKRVNLSALVRGVSSGLDPIVARYYTIIPAQDDARQFSYLDAVGRAGLEVVVKRLPPKGVDIQVTTAVEMTADIMAFALGKNNLSGLSLYTPQLGSASLGTAAKSIIKPRVDNEANGQHYQPESEPAVDKNQDEQRIITVVCPSKELSYCLALVKEYGVDTVSADFAKALSQDVLKSAAKWINLTDSETIWL